MKKGKLDDILRESLREEMKPVEMSTQLRQSILNKALKKENLYERFVRLMNTTIEIPLTAAALAAIFVIFIFSSSFLVTDKMKRDKTLYGVTSVKVMSLSGMNILLDKSDNEGGFYENN